MTSGDFRRDIWEKRTFLIERERPEYYASLFSLADVDQMIAFTRPVFEERTGFQSLPRSQPTYVRGIHADHSADPPTMIPGLAELRQVFDQGKTVVTMGMHKRWPAIAELCRNLESVFHCPVHANLYLTPTGSQGFAAHYDPHEVFILQLDGVKNWRLYDRTELLPLESDHSRIAAGSLGAARELVLKPGDLLYIPRGHVHDAYTTDSFSLHLTVGINVYRWADLLYHAVEQVIRSEPRFRQSIPGGALPEDADGTKHVFKQLLELLLQKAAEDESIAQAGDRLASQFFGQLSMLPGSQFSKQIDVEPIESDTVLARNHLSFCHVTQTDNEVAITFPGNHVTGPPRIATALRFIADRQRFTVRDLPGELTDQARIVLAKKLVREGLLVPEATGQSGRDTCADLREDSDPMAFNREMNSSPVSKKGNEAAAPVAEIMAGGSD